MQKRNYRGAQIAVSITIDVFAITHQLFDQSHSSEPVLVWLDVWYIIFLKWGCSVFSTEAVFRFLIKLYRVCQAVSEWGPKKGLEPLQSCLQEAEAYGCQQCLPIQRRIHPDVRGEQWLQRYVGFWR